jgi:hypothetical protein
MLTPVFRSWLVCGWFATLAVIIGVSVSSGASFTINATVLVLGVAPMVIMPFIVSAPSLTVAEILHAVETKDGRL